MHIDVPHNFVELFRKQLSLMLLLSKRHAFSAQENANHNGCFFSIKPFTWHLIKLINLNKFNIILINQQLMKQGKL